MKLFLVEISFGWTFWVEMHLQILFGRDFFEFGWLRSLFRYLGRMLVSNVFLVVVLLPHQQSLLSEKNLQIISAVQSFHVTKIKCTMQILIQNIESGFLVFDCVFAVPFLLVIQMLMK